MRPSLLQIRLFVAVYEEGSFTAAGAREGLGQSGVSQHMRQLEEELGMPLFSRERLIEPTPAAHAYYPCCIDLLRAHAQACEPPPPGQLSGTLRVGLIPTLTRAALGRSLLAFHKEHPDVAVELSEGYAGLLYEAVRRGQLDFAIVPRLPDRLPGIVGRLFYQSPAFLISSLRSELPFGTPVRLADVKPLHLFLPAGPGVRRILLERYLARQGVEVTSRLDRIESTLGALSIVRSSHWMMVMPGIFVANDLKRRRFTLNPLDPILWEELILIEPARRPSSPAGEAFARALLVAAQQADEVPTRVARGEPIEQVLADTHDPGDAGVQRPSNPFAEIRP